MFWKDPGKRLHHPRKSKAASPGNPHTGTSQGAGWGLTDSEVGQLCEVVPGTRHFDKIVQDMHSVELQALGLVHRAQDVLWKRTGRVRRGHGERREQELCPLHPQTLTTFSSPLQLCEAG